MPNPLRYATAALMPIARVIWFGAGWLLFVFGAGAVVLRLIDFTSVPPLADMVQMALVGFGVLTLPLAIGELQARAVRASSVGR